MDPIIIFVVLVLFGGIAAAHLASRHRARQGKPTPLLASVVATVGLVLLCAYCAFAVLSSFEKSDNALNYRVMFACAGLLAGGAAIRVGQSTLHR